MPGNRNLAGFKLIFRQFCKGFFPSQLLFILLHLYLHIAEFQEKKRRTSTALRRSASSDKFSNKSTNMNQSKSKDTLAPSIGDLVRSQSSTNVTGESKWKRKIKKLQATSAVTIAFCSAGNRASTASWKLLLQWAIESDPYLLLLHIINLSIVVWNTNRS